MLNENLAESLISIFYFHADGAFPHKWENLCFP